MDYAQVIITEDGRTGSVTYEQGGKHISGWWEFAGGDAIAIVNMGGVAEWQRARPWAVEHRPAIMRKVADEVIRQKATGCKAEIDEESGWITIRR